ncbi:MarR family transcriptional regulator [Sinomonas atrocyanea]|uniref:MarR family transcriptional regulator n=1 Tax=Sinomonas atrocyanea TaxID=37927 RepID=UPI003D9951F4
MGRLTRRMAFAQDPDNSAPLGAMAVLAALQRNGALTVGQLAAHEHVRPPSMTRTVTILEQAGCVTRTPHASDRRSILVSLTGHGREQLLQDRQRRDAWLARRLQELSPDQRTLLALAAPVLEELSRSAAI